MKTTFYVQLVPVWKQDGKLNRIVAERMTKERPRQPVGGAISIKLTVDIPDEAFMPLEPEAVIEIPVSHTHANPVVTVTSEPPDEEQPE